MSRTLNIVMTIAGGIAGAGVGFQLALLGECFLLAQMAPDDHTGVGLPVVIFMFALALLVGGTVGATLGTIIVRKILRRTTCTQAAWLLAGVVLSGLCYWVLGFLRMWVGYSAWLPMIGSVAVLAIAIAGAVIGAGRGARPACSPSGLQGVVSAGDTLRQQPGQTKCPFCRSTAFRVREEAGLRRCSDCHSLLPSYIQGNS